MPANCTKISKVTSGGGNWILRDMGRESVRSEIQLLYSFMKNWFRHHLDNFISFPLIYRFAGIRRVLTELEADNWKHRSNYTVTLRRIVFSKFKSTISGHCKQVSESSQAKITWLKFLSRRSAVGCAKAGWNTDTSRDWVRTGDQLGELPCRNNYCACVRGTKNKRWSHFQYRVLKSHSYGTSIKC